MVLSGVLSPATTLRAVSNVSGVAFGKATLRSFGTKSSKSIAVALGAIPLLTKSSNDKVPSSDPGVAFFCFTGDLGIKSLKSNGI
ncbi:hypothetical protein ES703_07540 [subsurface metagenome]